MHLFAQDTTNSTTTLINWSTPSPDLRSFNAFRNDTTTDIQPDSTTSSDSTTTVATAADFWNDVQTFFNIPSATKEYTQIEIGILSGALFLTLLSFIGTTLFAFKNDAVTYPLEREVFFLPSYR